MAPPTSHFDDLRVIPVAQLNKLSDELLVKEALRLVTNDDPHGYTRTLNVSIPQLLTIFATSAKSRDQGDYQGQQGGQFEGSRDTQNQSPDHIAVQKDLEQEWPSSC